MRVWKGLYDYEYQGWFQVANFVRKEFDWTWMFVSLDVGLSLMHVVRPCYP